MRSFLVSLCALSIAAQPLAASAAQPAEPLSDEQDEPGNPDLDPEPVRAKCRDTESHAVFDRRRIGAPLVPGMSGQVTIRLNPALGEMLPALRKQIEGIEGVRIGKDADYEVTVLRDMPQTLVLVDARQPVREWRFTLARTPDGCPISWQRSFVLGNIDEAEWPSVLSARLDEAVRVRRLRALEKAPPASDVETCFRSADLRHCGPGNYAPPNNDIDPDLLKLSMDSPVDVSIANKTDKPRHVMVIAVDAANGTCRLRFDRYGKSVRLEPNFIDAITVYPARVPGRLRLVTITSDKPFDAADWQQEGTWENEDDGGEETLAACEAPVPKTSVAPLAGQDWVVTSREFYVKPPTRVRIGGGVAAMASMAPWMAQIYWNRSWSPAQIKADAMLPPDKSLGLAKKTPGQRHHICGGMVIPGSLVLTAAHCVASGALKSTPQLARDRLGVRLGSVLLGGGASYTIDSIAVHQNYVAGQNHHDIALIRLKPTPPAVRAIPLSDTASFGTGTPFTTFGWGFSGESQFRQADTTRDVQGNRQVASNVLEYGPMSGVSNGECGSMLRGVALNRVVCARSPEGRADEVFTCYGDSGGPLVAKGALVGVVSFSQGCLGKVPTAFTSVAAYKTWIDKAKMWLATRPAGIHKVPD